MTALRLVGISANITFILYGLLAAVYPQLLLHSLLLPLNIYRFVEMRRLSTKVSEAAKGDLSMDWLKPFMHRRVVGSGERIFEKGEIANELFFVVSGRYRLLELGVEIGPGELIGEIGLIEPSRRRTLTFECIEKGELLVATYTVVMELYYQNPKFGFHLLELIGQRLFKDIARLETKGEM